MNTSSKSLAWIIVLALVAWGGWTFLGKRRSVSPEAGKPFVIGSVLPLTGVFGILGADIRRGAELAVEEAQATHPGLKYVSEDDQFEPKVAATAANKLISADKVDAAFTATVEEAKPMAPIFNAAQTPLLVVWDSNEFIKTAGPDIFTIGFSTEGNGEKMAAYAYGKRALRKIAIINHVDAWSEIIADAFEKKFEALGGSAVMHENALPSATDYRTQIGKAKAAGADALYFPLLPPANGIVAKQARQMGFTGAFLSGDSILQDEINAAGSAMEGLEYTTVYADNAKELLVKYKAKYGQDPTDLVFVSFGYDGIRTLVAAYDIAKDKGISVRDALTRVSIEGAGSRIDMRGGQYSERVERIYKVVNHAPILVE